MREDRNGNEERAFFEEMQDLLPPEPPAGVAQWVNPWRRAMTQILWGLGLTGITFQFWHLDYILPAIGVTLLLLGFRTLQGENRWFRGCYVLVNLWLALFVLSVVLNTTIWYAQVSGQGDLWLGTAMSGMKLALFVAFWRGLLAVRRKAGLPGKAPGAAALVAWGFILLALALTGLAGTVVVLGLTVGHFVILYSLYKLAGVLDESGYALRAAPARRGEGTIVLALLAVTAVGMACGYLFEGHYPMTWTPRDPAEQAAVSAISQHLLDLGFPEEVLEVLTPEDIAACEGATDIMLDMSAANNSTFRWKGEEMNDLRLLGVAVKLPGDVSQWRIFYYFEWPNLTEFCGTEAFYLVPEGMNGYGRLLENISGRLLLDRAGNCYTSPYHSLDVESYTNDNILGPDSGQALMGTFSLQEPGEHYRGYVACTAQGGEYQNAVSFYYIHQYSRVRYPVKTAKQRDLHGFTQGGTCLAYYDATQQIQVGKEDEDYVEVIEEIIE